MIDEVEEYVPGESAIAYKYVNEKEWYFKGHFPGNPIMPGVLITESLAQTGAVAILSLEEQPYRGVERKYGFYAFKGYRQLIVENYIIIYEVLENKKVVAVVTVKYGKSEF